MRRRARLPLIALFAAAVATAGCGSQDQVLTDPSVATGRFVGSDGKGVGVAVDWVGYDGEKRLIEQVLRAEAPGSIVGIASIVNRTTGLAPRPRFQVTASDGRLVAVAPARRTLRRGAVVALAVPGPYVPVQGAMTVYLVFRGTVDGIRGMQMRVGDDPPVRLSREPVGAQTTRTDG